MATMKKAQTGWAGGMTPGSRLKKVGEDLKQADRNYKTSDSLRKAEPKAKSFPANAMERKSNRLKADSLYKAGKKLEGMKNGGKMVKKVIKSKKK
jgi:hypothetical protein